MGRPGDFLKGHDPRRGTKGPGKPKLPPGTIKAVYEEFLEEYDGHRLMVDKVVQAFGSRSSKTLALAHMELASKVLDRTGDVAPAVTITFQTNVDPTKMTVKPGKP